MLPFFILDPGFDRDRICANRFEFLLESLKDLDEQLRSLFGSRLLVFRGQPVEVLEGLFKGAEPARLQSLYYERDTEPYARARDAEVEALARRCKIPIQSFSGHTIFDVDKAVAAPGFKPPISMSGMQALLKALGPVARPLPLPVRLPPLAVEGFAVPSLEELYGEAAARPSGAISLWTGGEREALRRLAATCEDPEYVAAFQKPQTASTGRPGKPWEPSTTGLSPYLKFGCLSVRAAWHAFAACCEGRAHSQPPQSLHGQLLFREMFYLLGASVPNFDQAEGNPMCKPIPWGDDPPSLDAWKEGRTGYPFIDALMRQLRSTGWMHHLGRHAVACFLTRGDLWQHWTAGRDHFDKYLLDADWALNNGNWLWLAGVAPFSSPYFRVYAPSPGAKSSLNAEQSGEFVRHFVPELRSMPDKFIYAPWKAPLAVQRQAKCIIGQDYPAPIVDHQVASDRNIAKFKAALEGRSPGGGAALPEKFGAGRRKDPGPMRTLFDVGVAKAAPAASAAAFVPAARAAGPVPTAERGEGGPGAAAPGSPQRKRRWGTGVVTGERLSADAGALAPLVQAIDISD